MNNKKPSRAAPDFTACGRKCLARWVDSLSRYRATIDAVLSLCGD